MKQIWKQRYQIMEVSGNGGNGRVYKVWDLHLEKEWAMKILEGKNRCFLRDGEENIDELQVLKKLSHSNFPRIVDAFEEDGRKILIMDYVRGVTLEDILKKGPMKETEILLILHQLCEAILYLHHQTPVLLYLDLKPANIMVEETGIVKLVDMGSVTVKGTKGSISGSFGFASPEQIRVQKEGSVLNEQSDIFSLGMVLYSMAAGECNRIPVVEANSRFGISIGKKRPKASVFLERVLEKCTRGVPDRRYTSIREVKKELEHWEKGIKKRNITRGATWWYARREKKRWYQEKSIFCTEGKHSFYIAKKIMILAFFLLCLSSATMLKAEEKQKFKKENGQFQQHIKDSYVKKQKHSEIKEEKTEITEDLTVFIRDKKFRKVLVKKGCAYVTNTGILLEVPQEAMGEEGCRITVECEEECGKKKRFWIECVYAK